MNQTLLRALTLALTPGLIFGPETASAIACPLAPSAPIQQSGFATLYTQQALELLMESTAFHGKLRSRSLFGHLVAYAADRSVSTPMAAGSLSPGSQSEGEKRWQRQIISLLAGPGPAAESKKKQRERAARMMFEALLAEIHGYNRIIPIVRIFRSRQKINRPKIYQGFRENLARWLAGRRDVARPELGYLMNYAARLRLRAASEPLAEFRQEKLLKEIRQHVRHLGGSFRAIQKSSTAWVLPVSFKINGGVVHLEIELLNHDSVFEPGYPTLQGLNLPLDKDRYAVLIQESLFNERSTLESWKRTVNHEIVEALRRAGGDSLTKAHWEAEAHEFESPDVLKEKIKAMTFSNTAPLSTSLGAKSSPWEFFEKGDAPASGYGQREVTGAGLTPQEAIELAAQLESRRALKPQALTADEVRRVGDFLRRFARDRNNPRSTILRDRAPLAWHALNDLIDLLSSYPQTMTINNRAYDFEIKSIPGNGPLEFKGKRVWGFPNLFPETDGKPGKIILYVSDLEGYEQDPERLAGFIYMGLTGLILPQNRAISAEQRHSIAFIAEAIALGDILEVPNENKQVILPARVKREIGDSPALVTHLLNKENRYWKVAEIDRRFNDLESIKSYLNGLVVALQDFVHREYRPASVPSVSTPAYSTQRIGKEIAYPTLEVTNNAIRNWAIEQVNTWEEQGKRIIDIRSASDGKITPLPIEDALEAAEKGMVELARNKDHLIWRTRWRLERVGGAVGGKLFKAVKDVRFIDTTVLQIKTLKFKVWVVPGTPSRVMIQLIRDDEEGPESFQLGERLTVARYGTVFERPKLAEFDSVRFAVTVQQEGPGYKLILENQGPLSMTVRHLLPPPSGLGSQPVKTAMLALPAAAGMYFARMSEILQMPFFPNGIFPSASTLIQMAAAAVMAWVLWRLRNPIKTLFSAYSAALHSAA